MALIGDCQAPVAHPEEALELRPQEFSEEAHSFDFRLANGAQVHIDRLIGAAKTPAVSEVKDRHAEPKGRRSREFLLLR